MVLKLIKSSDRILGGSAIAGIGLSFGRDVYRKAKKPGAAIIGIIILMSSFSILFIAGSLLTFEGSSSQESDAEGVEGSAPVEGISEIKVQESTAANSGQSSEFSFPPIGSSIGAYPFTCGVF